MNIYELTESILELQEMLETESDSAVLNEVLQGYEEQLETKAENYAKIIRNLEGNIEAFKSEEKRLKERRQVIENNISNLKRNLESSMIMLDKKKFKTGLFSFNIQKNPASLKVEEGALVPKEYLIEQEPKIDNKALKEDLKNGLEIEGISLVQTESLRIR